MQLKIRAMRATEVHLPLEWAAREGWNPGLYDAELFYAADPAGFFVGEIGGAPVATISAVRYGDRFGFIGLFIVRPDCRGGWLGPRLAQAALEHLGDRTIGIDGVLAKVRNYQTYGFALAHRNARYAGDGGGPGGDGTEPLAAFAADEIAAYDLRHFGFPRPAFLRGWLKQNEALSLALGVRRAGRLARYGSIRKCRVGYKIGPLFADDAEGAAMLCAALAARAAGSVYYLDIPESNPQALALVRARGMKEVFATARMYRGTPPVLPLAGIYGITSFELG
ncbi:MAG TPA: GNAT family N-acetyltransferase [bacterium]|nr:GNAT family N-acetyltransferase [bacterium]